MGVHIAFTRPSRRFSACVTRVYIYSGKENVNRNAPLDEIDHHQSSFNSYTLNLISMFLLLSLGRYICW